MTPVNTVLENFYTYTSITQHCYEQISYFVSEAHRHSGQEAKYRNERASGMRERSGEPSKDCTLRIRQARTGIYNGTTSRWGESKIRRLVGA